MCKPRQVIGELVLRIVRHGSESTIQCVLAVSLLGKDEGVKITVKDWDIKREGEYESFKYSLVFSSILYISNLIIDLHKF